MYDKFWRILSRFDDWASGILVLVVVGLLGYHFFGWVFGTVLGCGTQ